ncbi:LOW QUALITY PROTEIN: zinc finger and BTB domain-containing protein 12-like [Rhinatrema bivittatum]|uniref:LOW QUALITY PROTEIN: zinc finger and BTB domain-containing protein 12-like n=1 Tax=Rhinatrema bivittatum TaxID=194408 RepID=UPI00112902F7|nr:LOW QUALITY PROTEIN: zinc finger and BTB domain-containing protein 12-like [Rhinatrema bivittatum]
MTTVTVFANMQDTLTVKMSPKAGWRIMQVSFMGNPINVKEQRKQSVESALEVAHWQKRQQCIWLKAADEAAQQDESQVNSTVENTSLEHGQQGVVKACYSFSEDVEGEGLLIIPSSFHEEREATAAKCQSSLAGEEELPGFLLSVGSRPLASSGAARDGPRAGNPLKNLKCTKCEEVFQRVEKLVFHMRAHHFIFMCPRCGKQFNHSSNLNRHMNVHRGVKSHTCAICGKCFTQKSTLHDHMNLHSGERPYRCPYCVVRFAHKPAICRHLKEQHGKTTAKNVPEASVAKTVTVASVAADPSVAEINMVMR